MECSGYQGYWLIPTAFFTRRPVKVSAVRNFSSKQTKFSLTNTSQSDTRINTHHIEQWCLQFSSAIQNLKGLISPCFKMCLIDLIKSSQQSVDVFSLCINTRFYMHVLWPLMLQFQLCALYINKLCLYFKSNSILRTLLTTVLLTTCMLLPT